MARLPIVLASSVIRGTQLGESHGGLYRVDLELGIAQLKLDWNDTQIAIAGRGGDRGLRGIAFHRERVLVASNAALLILDQDFVVLESFTNPYLQHCHEISVSGERVFLAATGFDSVLSFDLKTKRFVSGWHLSGRDASLELRNFDPTRPGGPAYSHHFHINSVTASATGMWFSGLYTPGLLYTDGSSLSLAAELPSGTHNAQIWEDGVAYNDTAADRVCYERQGNTTRFAVPDIDSSAIVNSERFTSAVARPRFARGLCGLGAGLIAGGSSPSTLCVYDVHGGVRIAQHTLSMDVRNAVHGLAVWPYS